MLIVCRRCGKENPTNSKFCNRCGFPLDEAISPNNNPIPPRNKNEFYAKK